MRALCTNQRRSARYDGQERLELAARRPREEGVPLPRHVEGAAHRGGVSTRLALEREPVEAVWAERDEVRQVTDGGEVEVAEQLDRERRRGTPTGRAPRTGRGETG